ncbi:MAG: GNAT family N-acetyltransferase [Gammaproteobacteria bacterium]|nr:GNAT family N-acetyltransferase [Gammaproteobacteria bacterium]
MIKYINEVPGIEDYWPLFISTGWNEVFKMDETRVAKAISNSSFTVSAYSSKQLVGFARAVSDKEMYATIYDVMVLPEYRKKGVGKKLVENITIQCTEAGVFSVHLFAADGTESFYNQMGYQARPSNMPGMRYDPMDDK